MELSIWKRKNSFKSSGLLKVFLCRLLEWKDSLGNSIEATVIAIVDTTSSRLIEIGRCLNAFQEGP